MVSGVHTLYMLLVLSSAISPAEATGPTAFVPLSEHQIRSAIRNKSVGDGRHWEHRYLVDGRLVRAESGKAKGGRWSVERDQLCLLKPEISTTQPACFSVHRRGNELQYLDGERLVYQGFLARSSR